MTRDDDTCDCLVCEVRRWTTRHYPRGSDQTDAVTDVATQLGAVVGILSSRNKVALSAFFAGYVEGTATAKSADAEPSATKQ